MSDTQTSVTAIPFSSLPRVGTSLAGGLFAGLTSTKDGAHAAVVLLPNKADGRMPWGAAMQWADEAGGVLPTRPMAALLFANLRDQFEPSWHWTSEEEAFDDEDEDGASYAWYCYFDDGYQSHDRRSYEGCVRAVRLIPLIA